MQARRPAHATVCFGGLAQVIGIGDADRKAAGGQRHAGIQRVGGAIDPDQREALAIGRRAHGADRLVAGEDRRCPASGGEAVEHDANGAGARGAAMLHPRHHFLADVTALVEIDAVQAVHVGLVRKRVAIHEVEPAARHAGGDAMRFIGGAVDQIRADQVGDLLREFLRHQNPPAERGVARIGEGEVRLHRRARHPRPRARRGCPDRFSIRDLGAQFVETELVGERLRQRARAVDQEAAAMAGGRLGDQEIDDDLALRRQQRAEPAKPRAQQRHV